MKAIYNTRMKEYVTELTFISEKLKKYDEILTKKKKRKEKELSSINGDSNQIISISNKTNQWFNV